MKNSLEQCIDIAGRATYELGLHFQDMGTNRHADGYIPSQYRLAAGAIRDAMTAPSRLARMKETERILKTFRKNTVSDVRAQFAQVARNGGTNAVRQLSAYGKTGVLPVNYNYVSAVEAVAASLDAQIKSAEVLLELEDNPDHVLGTLSRAGVLSASAFAVTVAAWLVTVYWQSFASTVISGAGVSAYKKQAIAALDARTTDCCLRVHGQVQPLDGAFKLEGHPRYSDEQAWAPFHHYCRTSIALYRAEYDDGLTEYMQAGAEEVLAAREAGLVFDQHPANAFT